MVKNLTLSNLFQANVVEAMAFGLALNIHNLSQANSLVNYGDWQEQFEFIVNISRYMYTTVDIDTQSDRSEVDL